MPSRNYLLDRYRSLVPQLPGNSRRFDPPRGGVPGNARLPDEGWTLRRLTRAFFTRLPQQVAKSGEHKVCALVTPGIGRFGFTAVAHPYTGTYGVLQQVAEHRADVVVNDRGDVADLRYVVYVLNELSEFVLQAHEMDKFQTRV
ncbi:hypothetical protein EDD16DRAFT_1525955 [Pisolithus croceorrhizus]|nr:hypothetical protein EDD16DRAFT_1525955 [Pisolithus croceorrhizus]KAI6114673.1 hypothetical protein EV401DRAFT_1889891 [Pisolithus croceorrhizus]